MQRSIAYLLAIITLFWISGCSEPGQTTIDTQPETAIEAEPRPPGPDNRTAAEIIASAKILQLDAVQLGHAWRTTNDRVSEAESLLASGEASSARDAALRAEFSANASIKQARSEQGAWQDRFPK